jgi:hypothetical protein
MTSSMAPRQSLGHQGSETVFPLVELRGLEPLRLTRENAVSTAVSFRLVPFQSRSLPAVSLSGLDAVKSAGSSGVPHFTSPYSGGTLRKPPDPWRRRYAPARMATPRNPACLPAEMTSGHRSGQPAGIFRIAPTVWCDRPRCCIASAVRHGSPRRSRGPAVEPHASQRF